MNIKLWVFSLLLAITSANIAARPIFGRLREGINNIDQQLPDIKQSSKKRLLLDTKEALQQLSTCIETFDHSQSEDHTLIAYLLEQQAFYGYAIEYYASSNGDNGEINVGGILRNSNNVCDCAAFKKFIEQDKKEQYSKNFVEKNKGRTSTRRMAFRQPNDSIAS